LLEIYGKPSQDAQGLSEVRSTTLSARLEKSSLSSTRSVRDWNMSEDKNSEQDIELEAIRRRCENATRGPWRSFVEGRDHTSGSSFIRTGSDEDRGNDIELSGATTADQDFIAHARQDIPFLLAEIARLKVALGA
jgi:hypothetical protein